MLRGDAYRTLETNFGFLDIKPFAKNTYERYKKHIVSVAKEKVTSHFEDCAQIIFSYYQKELNRLPGEDGILDIDVSFDGELYIYMFIST